MLPDAFSTARLIRARIALSGSGAWRMRAGKHGLMSVVSVLPGAEFAVKLALVAEGKHLGQMFYPSGRPLSTRMDLRDPKNFASFMHNVDCCICDIPHHAEAAPPVEALYFVDAASSSRDPAVQVAAEALYDDGAEIDLGTDGSRWHIPDSYRALIEACMASGDTNVVEAAKTLAAVRDGSRSAARFDSHTSLRRWNRLVDQWIVRAHGAEQLAVQVGELSWIRLETAPAVVAAAREIGRLEGEFIDLGAPRLQDIIKGLPLDDTRTGAKPGPHMLDGSKSFFALMKGNAVLALATLEDGQFELHGSRKGQWPTEIYPAFLELRRELGDFGQKP